MMTNDEVYNEFCAKRCKYMNPPTLDLLDLCAECPISRMVATPPWYGYPDYTPPVGTTCLLANLDNGKLHYRVGIFRETKQKKMAFTLPSLATATVYPNGWQPIEPPRYFLQNKKRRQEREDEL